MALKRVARDVLPGTAMANVDECLLLKGVKPTDAFADELWWSLAHRFDDKDSCLWRGNGMRVTWGLNSSDRKNMKSFVITLETDVNKPPFNVMRSRLPRDGERPDWHVGVYQGVSRAR